MIPGFDGEINDEDMCIKVRHDCDLGSLLKLIENFMKQW